MPNLTGAEYLPVQIDVKDDGEVYRIRVVNQKAAAEHAKAEHLPCFIHGIDLSETVLEDGLIDFTLNVRPVPFHWSEQFYQTEEGDRLKAEEDARVENTREKIAKISHQQKAANAELVIDKLKQEHQQETMKLKEAHEQDVVKLKQQHDQKCAIIWDESRQELTNAELQNKQDMIKAKERHEEDKVILQTQCDVNALKVAKQHKDEEDRLAEQHKQIMIEFREQQEQGLVDIKEQHKREMVDVKKQYERDMMDMRSQHNEEMIEAKAQYKKDVVKMEETMVSGHALEIELNKLAARMHGEAQNKLWQGALAVTLCNVTLYAVVKYLGLA